MEVWKVHGEMVLADHVNGDAAAAAVDEIRENLKARGWGSIFCGAGMIVFDFYPPNAYTRDDAHRTAVEIIDRALDDSGVGWTDRRWTRVEPIAEERAG